MLPGRNVLTRREVLPVRALLARPVRPRLLARQPVRVGAAMRPGAGAVADPDCTGAQHAPQLTGARQVGPVAGAEGEVLGLTRKITAERARQASRAGRRGARRPAPRRRRTGEPVVRVGPRGDLLGIEPGVGDPAGQQRELVPAALPD